MNPPLQISKSDRHSKIAGNFGEALIAYWLSKHGFECAVIDHVGIDIIAKNPITKERMGISVKSRSRDAKTVDDGLNVPIGNYEKAVQACDDFGCLPYFALVVDHVAGISAFIVSLEKLKELAPPGRSVSVWKMSKEARDKYAGDPEVFAFDMTCQTTRWWKEPNQSPEPTPMSVTPPAAQEARRS